MDYMLDDNQAETEDKRKADAIHAMHIQFDAGELEVGGNVIGADELLEFIANSDVLNPIYISQVMRFARGVNVGQSHIDLMNDALDGLTETLSDQWMKEQ